MKRTIFPFIILLFFLANCKSPLSPHSSPKILYCNPKDTTITDSLRVVFHYQIDNANPNRNILHWNFGDGTSDTSFVSFHFFAHTFPGTGVYAYTVLLLDTISKVKLDSVTGTITVVETPPTLSELQQMKYFTIQAYCRVKNASSDDSSFESFYIDPFQKNDPGPISKGDKLFLQSSQLKWNINSFSFSYPSSWADTFYDSGVGMELGSIGAMNWQFAGLLSSSNNVLDSISFLNSYHETYNDSHGGHFDETIYISAKIYSLAWSKRLNGSLIYEQSGSDIINILKMICKDVEYNGFSYPGQIIPTEDNCGPTSAQTSSYVRIIFYK